ncbi:cobalt ABC transporter [Corynebacterium suranareeae]|uniref:Cobalt ABC transporter n=1 Tax=Corynebacterium suranareeae TaxID=2506452 RepID=A0A161JNT7_9CORY|nr:hypothetical protein [Corynebacterium suranareeae]BAU95462.1 cobalt ABC transporter [Corynebacterium suranareeae]
MNIVLIDGQSGAGKTTLALDLAAQTGFQLVHLDDFYPGWTGLAAASEIVAHSILTADNPGYHRWDWDNNKKGEWVSLIPGRSIIIEGAGSITQSSKARAAALGCLLTIRITGPEHVRKHRALKRDPGYAPFWDLWADQERQHFAQGIEVDHEIVLGSDKTAGRPEVIF